jgi:hypothetical protein
MQESCTAFIHLLNIYEFTQYRPLLGATHLTQDHELLMEGVYFKDMEEQDASKRLFKSEAYGIGIAIADLSDLSAEYTACKIADITAGVVKQSYIYDRKIDLFVQKDSNEQMIDSDHIQQQEQKESYTVAVRFTCVPLTEFTKIPVVVNAMNDMAAAEAERLKSLPVLDIIAFRQLLMTNLLESKPVSQFELCDEWTSAELFKIWETGMYPIRAGTMMSPIGIHYSRDTNISRLEERTLLLY